MEIDLNQPFIIRDRRNGSWYWVQKEVLVSDKIKSSAKLVYNALAFYANNRNQTAYPSATTISKMIKINRDTVFSALKELEKHKFIAIKRYSGKCNLYTLLRVVGNSDQYENKDGGSRNKGTGVVGIRDTNNTNEQDLLNNTFKNKSYPQGTEIPNSTPTWKQKHKIVDYKCVKKLKNDLAAKRILV